MWGLWEVPGASAHGALVLSVYQAELCLSLPGVNFLLLPAPHPCVPVAPAYPSSPFSCLRAWPCPAVDGKWQAWASWGSCSVTCGGGTQRRERACLGPFFGGAACQGPQDEYRQCGAQRCPGECLHPTPQLDREEAHPEWWGRRSGCSWGTTTLRGWMSRGV